MSRSFGVILTTIFPLIALIASAATFPLVLQNSPARLLLIAALLLSPLVAVLAAARLKLTPFYLAVFGTLTLQIIAEAILNYW